jgi:scyllo-inositol 2-dehydrogenase (NADP+)
MKKDSYGLAVVGFGGMGKRHTEIISKVERIKLKGVYDILEERNEYARSLGMKSYESFEAVLEDPDVDIVVIATPNNVHKEIAVRALLAGKNVICEKPVTMSGSDMEEIMATAEENRRLFVAHQNRRWDEDFLTIKKIYDEGIVGDVYRLESRAHGSRGIPGGWRRIREQGGGMLLDWGVHLIDQVLFMVKECIQKVYCKLSYILGEEVDDGFSMFLTFESGKTALIEVGTWNFDSLPRWYVCGRKGTAVLQDWNMNGRLAMPKDGGILETAPVKLAAGYSMTMAPRTDNSIEYLPLPKVKFEKEAFYRNVLDAIEGKSEAIVSNDEVLRVIRLIEAAFESDRLGQAVDFE